MKILLELDTSAGEPGARAAYDVIGRVYGLPPAGQGAASTPAPAGAPAPSAPAPAPAAPPMAPPPSAGPTPPSAVAPAPAMAPGAVTPPPMAAASPSSVPPPAPPSAGGDLKAQLNAKVQEYAKAFKPAGVKARFAQMAEAFKQPTWASGPQNIPEDQIPNIIAWFDVPAA